MNQIYARLKRLRAAPFRRVISGEALFGQEFPLLDACAEYDASTLLESDEWFKVSDFSERAFFPEFLNQPLNSTEVDELRKSEFGSISYLMSVEEGNYCFQRVKPALVVRRKVLGYGDAAYLEQPETRIVINERPDAVYIPASNALLFRDLAAVAPLFSGIDELFREATDEQVSEFLQADFVTSDMRSSSVSKPNRKRIALAMETLSKLAPADRTEVIRYTRGYSDDRLVFEEESETFVITSDEDLKMLLYGIEQRYYTTIVGAERRLANSIIRLTN